MKELKNESDPETKFINTFRIVGLIAILLLLFFGAFNVLLN
jgi:hypothetical protein